MDLIVHRVPVEFVGGPVAHTACAVSGQQCGARCYPNISLGTAPGLAMDR
jgi:hypothetical protein